MFPLLWVIAGIAAGAGVAIAATRPADRTRTLGSGQIWTLVIYARPTHAWIDISKGEVARAIRISLASMGVIPIDALWTGNYQLTVAASVLTATTLEIGQTFALASEWADQATITSIDRAPASIPVASLGV